MKATSFNTNIGHDDYEVRFYCGKVMGGNTQDDLSPIHTSELHPAWVKFFQRLLDEPEMYHAMQRALEESE